MLAGAAAVAACAMFALGVVGLALSGFDPWQASSVASNGVWAALLGWFALAGWRPEARRRMVAGLIGAFVGAGIGVLLSAVLAPRLAPGSETAPVLVMIFAVPLASTLGLIVGWCLPRRKRSEADGGDVPGASESTRAQRM